MDINAYWQAVINKDASAIQEFFSSEACINWHNTNESFTVGEFIKTNCAYPGEWAGEVLRTEKLRSLYITVTRVFSRDRAVSFHAISFIDTMNEKIVSIDEYWSEDCAVPEWRAK